MALLSSFTSALMGSYSQLFGKILWTAIMEAGEGPSQLEVVRTMWLTWAAPVGLLICAPLQIYLLNRALGASRATFGACHASATLPRVCLPGSRVPRAPLTCARVVLAAVPVYFVMIITLTILLDGLFFRIFRCMEDSNGAIFASSLTIIVVGVGLLSFQQERRKERTVLSDDVAVAAAADKPHVAGKPRVASPRTPDGDATSDDIDTAC